MKNLRSKSVPRACVLTSSSDALNETSALCPAWDPLAVCTRLCRSEEVATYSILFHKRVVLGGLDLQLVALSYRVQTLPHLVFLRTPTIYFA